MTPKKQWSKESVSLDIVVLKDHLETACDVLLGALEKFVDLLKRDSIIDDFAVDAMARVRKAGSLLKDPKDIFLQGVFLRARKEDWQRVFAIIESADLGCSLSLGAFRVTIEDLKRQLAD